MSFLLGGCITTYFTSHSMYHNDSIFDSYDRDMLPFYESDNYKYQHATNNRIIAAFRSTLSPDQQADFTRILNSLSTEYSDVALEAYSRGREKRHNIRYGI